MRQQATVVMHDGRLMADVVRSEACQACHACNFGQQDHVYIEVDGVDCKEGDIVNIDIDEGSVSRASVLAYGVPAAAFFAGLFAGAAVSDTDYIQAIFALAGLAAGLAAVKLADIRAKKSGRYRPRVSVSKDN